jgi:hypothetical protein
VCFSFPKYSRWSAGSVTRSPWKEVINKKVRNIASLMEVLQGASQVCFLILLPDLDSYICLTCHKKRLPVIYKKPTCAMDFAIFVSNLSGTGQHY